MSATPPFRADHVGSLLRPPELPPPVHQFLATGDPDDFARLGRRFLGPEIGSVGVADFAVRA